MTILGLDTAGDNLHLGLLRNDVSVAKTIDAHRRHAELLPQAIIDFLAEQGSSLEEITGFAVVSGPGSFTGLRVGASTIMGLAAAADTPTAPVSTLELWRAIHGSSSESLGCLIHCRGDLFYWSEVAARQDKFHPVTVLSVEEIARLENVPKTIAVSDDRKTQEVLHKFRQNTVIVPGSGEQAGKALVELAAKKIAAGGSINWRQWQLDYGPTPGFRKWNKPN